MVDLQKVFDCSGVIDVIVYSTVLCLIFNLQILLVECTKIYLLSSVLFETYILSPNFSSLSGLST